MRVFQNSLADIVFDTLKQRPLARLSYRLCGPISLITIRIETTSGIGNLALIPFVTPRDRALCEFQQSRQIPHNTRFRFVIDDNIAIVHEYSTTTTEEMHIQEDSNESGIQLIHYKEPKDSGRLKVVSSYGQDTNWTKSPEDNQWRPIPAQAKPEGFPS